ncbi:MAG: Redoxin [Acidimicrobiales bacterium]|nr:Redoxin [Acidimicrobiales bacterium]
MTATRPSDQQSSALWIGIIVVVLALGVVAVVIARGSGSGSGSTATKATVAPGAQVCANTAPVTSDGSGAQDLPAFQSSAGDDALCATIPTIKGKDLDGKSMTIGPADGTAKVVMFVAHWCPHCQREVPLIAAHLKKVPLPSDVELLTVSTGVQPTADNYPPKAWLEREHWPARTLADTSDNADARAYGLTSYPYFVVADSKGRVIYRTSGEITTDQFDALVNAARTGTSPA